MKISNNNQIARRLRYVAADDLGGISLQKRLAKELELENTSWRGVLRGIADLIDRQTCRNVYDETEEGGCENGFKCSECGNIVEDCEGYRIIGEFNYCSKCGASVVTDDD